MDAISRRTVLSGASLTAIAGAVAAGIPFAGSASAAPAPKAAPLQQQVLARVTDLSTGEVELFIDDREVTIRDAKLAHAIAHAAQTHAV